MTTTNDSLKLAELLKTPICKMDGEELAFLITIHCCPLKIAKRSLK